MPKSKASKRRHNFVRRVRAEGALTAYENALRWVHSLPIFEVENRLNDKIRGCNHEIGSANAAARQLEGEEGGSNNGKSTTA